jgi:predicted metalloendopeptidase
MRLVAVLAATACSTTPLPPAAAPRSGIDTAYVDAAVRPQDDLYRHLNGRWLESFQIPADKGRYGSFDAIDDKIQDQLHGIVDALVHANSADDGAAPLQDADAKKIADLYSSFMVEPRLEALGIAPLRESFARIAALASKQDIPGLIAHFNRIDATAPYRLSIGPDAKDSTRYAVTVAQSGLGLPDRDYYLKDDAKLQEARAKYAVHVENMLRLAGDPNAKQSAADILTLETALAQLQWTRVENRDPEKTYNKVPLVDLDKWMPRTGWREFLAGSGVAGKVDYLILRQPSYFRGLDDLIDRTPLTVWKSYFKWQALAAAAPYLSKEFVNERFSFTGTVLRGIPEDLPRWKRGLALVNTAIGEGIGRLYVEKYFPAQNKVRMKALVANLLEAYRRDIDRLDWMSAATKQGAQAKLAKLTPKIGYPDRWRDYSALRIERDDLWGNVRRANEFNYLRNLNKLGTPIDRNEWGLTPQTVNAYYNPEMNEIVFPAAILQPPFFDAGADDAANYGGIVAVIGHEVSHGFDDQGSQYDADGNLRDWFTPEDHARFAAKAKALVAQYDAYEPIAGYHVNGQLTLGENIADNAGLTLAYKAYQFSLGGKPAPVIDGLTGEQRFYLGWVQVWRSKARENETIRRIKTDPHAPAEVRGTAPVRNQSGFYAAFGVKPADKMYLPPDDRVLIW